MSLAFPTPAHMPCPDCGASVSVADATTHVCDEDRRLDYRLVELRPGIDRFDDELAGWLETPQGRFARWLAERGR
ncbi:MAG: hypothetical protein ACXVQQ_01340 [Gaiellaceae bacterium]